MRFSLLKAIGGPGSLGFLMLGLAVSLALMLTPRTRRWGLAMLWCFALTYWMLSLPAFAHLVSARLGEVSQVRAQPGMSRDIFILHGDNYRERAKVAARMYDRTTQQTFWVLGGSDVRVELVRHGVPDTQCRWGAMTEPTTLGQVRQVRTWVLERRIESAVIVTSRIQAARVTGLARRLGINARVIAAPVEHEPPSNGVRVWVPSPSALTVSRDALYEWAALAYYRWRNWI